MDDLFTEPGLRLPTIVARPRPVPRRPEPRWAWPTPLRMTVTVVLFTTAGLLNAFGWIPLLLLPLAAVACQALRRPDVLRWSLWSVVAAALLLVAPFVFFAGSQLRDV